MRHLKCKYIISYTALKALKRRVYPSFLPSFWKGKLIVCSVIYVIGENTVIIVLIHYYFIFKDNIHLTNHSTLRLRYIGKHHPVFCTYFVLYFVYQVPKVDWSSGRNKPRRAGRMNSKKKILQISCISALVAKIFLYNIPQFAHLIL